MKTESKVPKGEHCYIVDIFTGTGGETCPYYDGQLTMNPTCRKYGYLTWNISGNVIKHPDCLNEKEE